MMMRDDPALRSALIDAAKTAARDEVHRLGLTNPPSDYVVGRIVQVVGEVMGVKPPSTAITVASWEAENVIDVEGWDV